LKLRVSLLFFQVHEQLVILIYLAVSLLDLTAPEMGPYL